jgi:alanine racemase
MKQHTSWVEVDKRAIKSNLTKIKDRFNKTKILAVVKANAYGHGDVEVSHLLLQEGIDYLGVSLPVEALKLRKAGIAAPILVMSPALEEDYIDLIKSNCTLTISNFSSVVKINEVAERLNKKVRVHVNVDTGMGRYGVKAKDFENVIQSVVNQSNLTLEGVYTHFPKAEDKVITKKQFSIFEDIMKTAQRFEASPIIFHCSNTTAAILYPEMKLNMTRLGSLIFGHCRVKNNLELEKTWKLKSRIINVLNINKGESVGYGCEFIANKAMKVAIIPLGFHDGIGMWPNHASKNKKSIIKNVIKESSKLIGSKRFADSAIINNKKAYYVGKVGMQHVALDITEHENVSIGDVVTLSILQTAVNRDIPVIYKEV